MFTTDTDKLGSTGMDPAIWSVVAAVGAAMVYLVCLT
jgi:hypothetical protein